MGSRKRAKPAEHRPTPGPYSISEQSYGVEVSGIYGVGIAWFGTNGTYGKLGHHAITKAEAMANARALVEALEARRAAEGILASAPLSGVRRR